MQQSIYTHTIQLYDFVVENIFVDTVILFVRSDHGMSDIFLLLTLFVFLLYR